VKIVNSTSFPDTRATALLLAGWALHDETDKIRIKNAPRIKFS